MYVLLRSKFWQLTFAVAVILLGSPLVLTAQDTSPANDMSSWPTFLGPNQDGKSNQKNILKDWSGGKLKLLWQHETGKGYGIGSVADGKFYHFGLYDDQTRLTCLDCTSGIADWTFKYKSNYDDLYGFDAGPRATPIIDGDHVYTYGVEGQLHCLDKTNGQVVWKKDLNKQFGVIQNFFGVASSPTIFENLIIVMVGGSPEESQKIAPGRLNQVKPNRSGIVAFDKLTGEVRYQTVNDLASYASLRIANINGKPTLLAWMRESLYGVEPRSGKELFSFYWRARILESVNAATPVAIGKDKILLTECYERGAVLLHVEPDKTEPKLVWSDKDAGRKPTLRSHWHTPIVIGDYAYGCNGQKTATADLRCFNWKTGKVQWKYDDLSRASITWVDDHFVVLGEEGELLLIKANPEKIEVVTRYESGDGENQIKFKRPCWAAPVISDGKLFVRGRDKLACFQLAE